MYPEIYMHTGEVLRRAHCALNFGRSKVADIEIKFFDFLQIQAILRKTNYITFSYLLILFDGESMKEF